MLLAEPDFVQPALASSKLPITAATENLIAFILRAHSSEMDSILPRLQFQGHRV
jgi:hypothetical protein